MEVCEADLDVLAALVDKNLVHRNGDRFTMLETIHEYAAERLAESGEEDTIRDRHAQHFLALARQRGDAPHGRARFDLDQRFERETANTSAAFERLRNGDPIGALELALPHLRNVAPRELIEERRDRLEEALSRAADASPVLRARALTSLGDTLFELGDTERAVASFEAGLADAERAGAQRDAAILLLRLTRFDEALERFRRLGDDDGASWALHWLGNAARDRGDFARARELLEESVALTRRTADPRALGAVLHSLGDCALDEGAIEEAEGFYQETLEIANRLNHVIQTAYALGGLASVEAHRGRPESAGRLWGAVQAWERAAGYFPLHEGERVRYERALAGVPIVAPGPAWRDVFADAVAYARSL